MCFSATANFVGSGVLGAVGVVTLTKVKHRREPFRGTPAVRRISSSKDLSGYLSVSLSPVAHDMGAHGTRARDSPFWFP